MPRRRKIYLKKSMAGKEPRGNRLMESSLVANIGLPVDFALRNVLFLFVCLFVFLTCKLRVLLDYLEILRYT